MNLNLNKIKCKFRQTQVSYVDHLITDQGVKPDNEKVTDINDIPTPKGPADIHRFLGMTNYLSKLIDNFSEILAPLRRLLHKEAHLNWQPEHQKIFDDLKRIITRPPFLSYYDVSQPLTITCDACQFGLGCACFQDGKPIALAARTMKDAEQNYVQIEKELLAIVFACSKFHQCIYGKHISLETDHQPLVTILKPLHKAPASLQKMMLQLQRYDFDMYYI